MDSAVLRAREEIEETAHGGISNLYSPDVRAEAMVWKALWDLHRGDTASVNDVRAYLTSGVVRASAFRSWVELLDVVSARARGMVYRLGGIAIIAMGLLFIRRGILSYAAM